VQTHSYEEDLSKMPALDTTKSSHLGAAWSAKEHMGKAFAPQVSWKKTNADAFPNSGNLVSGGYTTNGTRPMDPSLYTDLHSVLSGSVVARLDNKTFGVAGKMGITWPNVVVQPLGSGISVEVGLLGSGSVELHLWKDASTAYFARASQQKVDIVRKTTGVDTVISSFSITPSNTNSFRFLWDGISRFKAEWNSLSTVVTDATHSPLGSQIRLIADTVSVTAFDAGRTYGLNGFDEINPPALGVPNWQVLSSFQPATPPPVDLQKSLTYAYNTSTSRFISLTTNNGAIPVSSGGAPTSSTTAANSWVTYAGMTPPFTDFLVWRDNVGLECGVDASSSYSWATPGCTLGSWDYARYRDLFLKAYTKFKTDKPGAFRLYGPNCVLAPKNDGHDVSCNGVMVAQKDLNFLNAFLSDLRAATPVFEAAGVAVSGDFTASQWVSLLPYLQTLVRPWPLIVTVKIGSATPTLESINEIAGVLDSGMMGSDVAFLPYEGFVFSPLANAMVDNYDWSFRAELSLPETMTNAQLKTVTITDNTLKNASVVVVGEDVVYNKVAALPSVRGFMSLGDLSPGTYSITIYGDKGVPGMAELRIGIYSDSNDPLSLVDSRVL